MSKISRKEQAINTERNIINAMIELLKTYSFQELQIKQICRQANTSVGNFYHHFHNKHGIIMKILDDNYAVFEKNIQHIPDNASFEHIIIILQEFCHIIESLGHALVLELFVYSIISGDNFLLSNDKGLYKQILNKINKLKETQQINSSDTNIDITKNIIIVFRGFLYEWCLSKNSYNLTQNISQQLQRYLSLFE